MRTPKRAVAVVVVVLSSMLTGCTASRRVYAKNVDAASAPMVSGYRAYVQKDPTLTDSDKRIRLSLVDEFVAYVQGGEK